MGTWVISSWTIVLLGRWVPEYLFEYLFSVWGYAYEWNPESYGNFMINWGTVKLLFHGGFNVSRFHRQGMRVPISPHPTACYVLKKKKKLPLSLPLPC